MEDIRVGKHSFNYKALRSITLDVALSSFTHINRAIVERAWKIANPEDKKPKTKKIKGAN